MRASYRAAADVSREYSRDTSAPGAHDPSARAPSRRTARGRRHASRRLNDGSRSTDGSSVPEGVGASRARITKQVDNVTDSLMQLVGTHAQDGIVGLLETIEKSMAKRDDRSFHVKAAKATCSGGVGLPGAFTSVHPDTGLDDAWGDMACADLVHALGLCAKHYRRYARWCRLHGVEPGYRTSA